MILGITGGIGSGKSTISKLISLYGIPVYIADIESKKLTATSPSIREKLIEAFGENLYNGNILNKQLFASIIFNDKQKLEIANKIIHPEVEANFNEWCSKRTHYPILAKESAILFESGFNRLVDKIVMVYTPLEERIERVMKRDGVTRELVMERISSQMSDEEKASKADFIIRNDENTFVIPQIDSLLSELRQNN